MILLNNENTANYCLLSMPPNSQPAKPTHGGTAASQLLAKTKINKHE